LLLSEVASFNLSWESSFLAYFSEDFTVAANSFIFLYLNCRLLSAVIIRFIIFLSFCFPLLSIWSKWFLHSALRSSLFFFILSRNLYYFLLRESSAMESFFLFFWIICFSAWISSAIVWFNEILFSTFLCRILGITSVVKNS